MSFLILQSSPGFPPRFSYIRRFGSFFWFKILNFNIFWVSRKINIFLGYEDFGGEGGSSQNWTLFRGHLYAFYGLI